MRDRFLLPVDRYLNPELSELIIPSYSAPLHDRQFTDCWSILVPTCR